MPLYRTYIEGEFLLGIWKSDETTEQLLASLEHKDWYREKLAVFSEKRKHEWLSVRVLLKALCGEEKEIAYYSSGRPYLKDGSRYISISHTRGYVAVALHSSCEVGMDIEQYGTRVRKVASRFIRSDEEPAMMEGDEVYALLLHWSAKEALFKTDGSRGGGFHSSSSYFSFQLVGRGGVRGMRISYRPAGTLSGPLCHSSRFCIDLDYKIMLRRITSAEHSK